MPHCGGLVEPMVPLAGRGVLMEMVLQMPHRGGLGGLELGVIAAHPFCRTSWSRCALGQGTGGGRRRPQPWGLHARLAVVAPAAALPFLH